MIQEIKPDLLEQMEERLQQALMASTQEILRKLDSTANPENPEFLTRAEFAERAQISSTKLYLLTSQGKLKAHYAGTKGKKLMRIPFSELQRFLRGEIK